MEAQSHVIIIGGGAAGLFCAIESGRRGRSVIVLDHMEQVGKKILVSGGGRCNFTNLQVSYENYLSENPKFSISALSRYTPQDFMKKLDAHQISYHEKKFGQMFCDNSSKNILAMLLEESEQSGVKIIPQCRIQSILKTHKFIIESSRGEFQSDSLVIATGGLSVPSLGATDFGYQIATQFGHRIISPSPALVPLVFNAKEQKKFVELAGISMEAEVRTGKTVFRDDLLFTHKGLSGPAILQISSYWNPGQEIVINLYPYGALDEKLITLKKQYPNKQLDKLMTLVYPERFISHWWKPYEYSKPMIQYPDKELKLIASQFQNWKIVPADTEGYLTAEVTRGGINTRDINPTTMESKRIPGLYFVGEILDVTGWLGGYNFQWAWSSGWAAGQAV